MLGDGQTIPNDETLRGAARADLCRFLAACHYQPEPAFAEEGLFASMQQVATVVDPDFAAAARRLGDAFAADGQERLLLDYTRLFLGPVDTLARPYESCWRGDATAVMGESTVSVIELYHQAGFEIDQEFRDLPDHIAVELEFLYVLLFRENAATAEGDRDAAGNASALRRRFLDEHLGTWVGPFTAAVASGASSDFYRELAALTGRFVASEMRRGA